MIFWPRQRDFLVVAAFVSLAACDGAAGPERQGPGTVTARIVAPTAAAAATGAVLLELSGEVTDVTGRDGTVVQSERRADGSTLLMLVASDAGALAFDLALPERSRTPLVRILEVADTANVLRTNLGDYKVTF